MYRRTSLIFLLLTTSAMAGPREDTFYGISRCASLPDDRAVLDCIYGAAQPLRAALGLPPASPAQIRLVPRTSQASQASQPIAAPPPTAQKATGSILTMFDNSTLHMASYAFDKRGHFTVTLSDGTAWRQDANDTNFAHFDGKASRYSVSVVPGEFRSRLDVRGEDGSFVVERLR